MPYVVLLGEPGMGKSIVLAQEAGAEHSTPIKVRELIAFGASKAQTLFLDALDEYRMDGAPAHKAYELSRAIAQSGATRWRLTCRSEDWRKTADIAAIQSTTEGQAITVAQLLPLDDEEAEEILRSFGRQDAAAFVAKARAMGANAFIESPLSLLLLDKAVGPNGAWPSNRFWRSHYPRRASATPLAFKRDRGAKCRE